MKAERNEILQSTFQYGLILTTSCSVYKLFLEQSTFQYGLILTRRDFNGSQTGFVVSILSMSFVVGFSKLFLSCFFLKNAFFLGHIAFCRSHGFWCVCWVDNF